LRILTEKKVVALTCKLQRNQAASCRVVSDFESNNSISTVCLGKIFWALRLTFSMLGGLVSQMNEACGEVSKHTFADTTRMSNPGEYTGFEVS
jgi:hypothetical protein